jgi:hypothetical protein
MNKALADEIEELSSGLLSGKENSVPEGYFEHLPGQVLNRWNRQKRKGNPSILRFQKMIAAAAIVSGISFTVALFSPEQKFGTLAGEISSADAYDYIFYHINEFDTLLEEPLSLAGQNDVLPIEQDAIEDFLLDELDGSALDLIF